jgi:hypothetical protein
MEKVKAPGLKWMPVPARDPASKQKAPRPGRIGRVMEFWFRPTEEGRRVPEGN